LILLRLGTTVGASKMTSVSHESTRTNSAPWSAILTGGGSNPAAKEMFHEYPVFLDATVAVQRHVVSPPSPSIVRRDVVSALQGNEKLSEGSCTSEIAVVVELCQGSTRRAVHLVQTIPIIA
jgi:hypothetical protein